MTPEQKTVAIGAASGVLTMATATFAIWADTFLGASRRRAHFFIFSRPMKSRLPSGTPLVRRMS